MTAGPQVTIRRAYRVELAPNNRQRTALLRHAGAARYAYNWGLRRKIEAYRTTGKSLTAIDLHRELNVLKRTPKEAGGVPWLYEVSKCAPQEALRHLDRAFANFFRRCKEGATRRGFPRFKSRKRGIGGFTVSGARVEDCYVALPRIGPVRLKERGYMPTGRPSLVTISERAGHWFVSFAVKEPFETLPPTGEPIGIDVGVEHLATMSDGTVFKNPRALKAAETSLCRLQKSVSRKVKGSNNRRKAKEKLARRHYRVSNVRRDAIQKATTATIAKRPAAIGIEDLHVGGMFRNHHLARVLSDVSMSEFLRVLTYKATWAGILVVKADRWFPSSKTCSRCGAVHAGLTLGDRTFRCPACGLALGRDLNAAINLRNLAASSAVTACGAGSSGQGRKALTKLPAMKQEPNTGVRCCA